MDDALDFIAFEESCHSGGGSGGSGSGCLIGIIIFIIIVCLGSC